jgi:TolA-binding protein
MNRKTRFSSEFSIQGKSCLILLFFLFFIPDKLSSQLPFTERQMNSEFNRAMELFNKEKYPAAIRLFDEFAQNNGNDQILAAEAEYYAASAALKVFNGDAEYRMMTYINNHPESPRINASRLEVADYFYQNKLYRKAVDYYESINRQELEGEKLSEYFFRLGYSLYVTGNKERALLMFSEIKDIDTEYTPPAIYYFSQIAYEQKMYRTAMDGFMKLRDDETFGKIVPFYIVQILYIEKDYDGILEIAPGLLNSAGKERAVELYRFIGDAYYNKGNYTEALTYLEKYAAGSKVADRGDKFELGYCYYKTGDTDKAIKTLLEIGSGNDALSQNIWHVLGDCYLKKGDKKRAQFAFGEASKMNFDKRIREEALFNYAKLTYEVSNSPFGEAIEAFQQYIDLFPGSPKIQEAYDYLVGTYTQLKNYKAALSSLDKIQNKTPRLEEAYQRVAFFRGLELFKNLQFEASSNMFDKSLAYQKINRTLRARAIYWRGESMYRLHRYDKAADDYQSFMGIPGSGSLSESELVRYNLGSAYFNMGDYQNALSNFLSFESSGPSGKSDVIADVRNRIADCYYIQTNYKMAVNYYDKVIDYGKQDVDYAMFQKAFSLGLMNDLRGKIDILTSLIGKYPSSPIIPNAIYERGRAYVVVEDYKKGETDFNTVISSYKESPFVPQAMVQLGLLYYNLGQNENAITQFKRVIENYKSTPEARYAMTGLKNTYVEMNDVSSYFAYVKSFDGYDNIDVAAKDSMIYTSGEKLYMTAKYDKAAETFRNYLNEFPEGIFKLNAQFYLAEALRFAGNEDEALKLYREVAAQPNNQFTEQTLATAADILYRKEEFGEANDFFEKLEKAADDDQTRLKALRGQLGSAYEAGDAQKTIDAAGKIISSSNVPEELMREAIFMNARANYSLNRYDEALRDFRKVATEVTSEEGAESKYMVAELLYRNGKIDESEKVVNEFIDKNTPHQYWMAKVFLLLSDISLKKGDTLQARATLQSLKDYYSVSDDGILDEVNEKLNSVAGDK